MVNLEQEIKQKYFDLKKFCPNHTLLDLINIKNRQIIFSSDFLIVYNSKKNLSEYSSDLEKAIKEEQNIRKYLKKHPNPL